MCVCMYIYIYIYIYYTHTYVSIYSHAPVIASRAVKPHLVVSRAPSPPTKSSGFRGFDSSRLLILRGGILMSVNFDRGSPGKFDSRALNRKTLNRWTGRTQY